MATKAPKGVQEQIAFALTNTDLTSGQIEYKMGVSQNTVRAIGRELYGDNLKTEMERRKALLREQITELKLRGLTVVQICVQLGISKSYFTATMARSASAAGKAGAGTGRTIESLPALEQQIQDDDEQEVNIISISGTPIEAVSRGGRSRAPVQKDKKSPQALSGSCDTAVSAGPSEVGVKVGAAELKFNLDGLNAQRVETLCCLIERLGKGDLR